MKEKYMLKDFYSVNSVLEDIETNMGLVTVSEKKYSKKYYDDKNKTLHEKGIVFMYDELAENQFIIQKLFFCNIELFKKNNLKFKTYEKATRYIENIFKINCELLEEKYSFDINRKKCRLSNEFNVIEFDFDVVSSYSYGNKISNDSLFFTINNLTNNDIFLELVKNYIESYDCFTKTIYDYKTVVLNRRR